MGRKIKECDHCHLLKPTHGHGYCSTCCHGLRKNSSFIPYNLRPVIPKFTPCSVWDCNEQIRRKIHVGLYAGKSYCEKHGWAIKQYGEPLDKTNGSGFWYFPEPKEPYIPPKCDIKHCNSKVCSRVKVGLHIGKGYCRTHLINLFDLGAPIDKRRSCSIDGVWIFPEDDVERQKCGVKDCESSTTTKIHVGLYAEQSYCSKHGEIIKRYSEPIANVLGFQGFWRFPESLICSVDWCNSYVIDNELCVRHNQVNSIHGNPEPNKYQCCIETCQNKTMFMNDRSNGFCLKHKNLDKVCIVQDCNKSMCVGGRCSYHYGTYKRYGSFLKVIPFPEDMYCQVQGCNSICISNGGMTGRGRSKDCKKLCSKHWQRLHKNGTVELLPTLVSKPMEKFEKLCNEYGITIDEKEKRFGIYPVDYVIKNIVVQIDGDYFHANPKPYSNHGTLHKGYKSNDMIFNRTVKEVWAKDKRRDKVVREAGYEVIRFWESDITMKPEQCMEYLLSRLTVYTIVI